MRRTVTPATTIAACCLGLAIMSATGCHDSELPELSPVAAGNRGGQPAAVHPEKTAVLLVSHGSHSPEWRKMLHEFRDGVATRLLALPGIADVKTAFMEYHEPSIATSLKELDQEGCGEVILVPLLLTVSSHSFDDIPTIIGAKEDAKSLMTLRAEGIERYTPRARVTITPLLDFSSLLKENVATRIAALSKNPAAEGVVVVAYGDATYNDEWEAFFGQLDKTVQQQTGVASVAHCWCGHIVHYSKEPTQKAIRQILDRHQRAIVIPALVARDKRFQDELIGQAIAELNMGDRVAYVPDAILPDSRLDDWVVTVTQQTLEQVGNSGAKRQE